MRALGSVAVSLAMMFAAADVAAANTTALNVSSVKRPQHVFGSDGRGHLVYNLVITNVFTAGVTLNSLEVRAGGKTVLNLRGRDLAESIRPFGGGGPVQGIDVSSSAVIYVDVPLARSKGRKAPKRIRNRISYTFPADAPVGAVIGRRNVTRDLKVDRRGSLVVAPPLRGGGWSSANGCCDPSVPHRSTVLSANGRFVSPETFAVDYIRIVDGHVHRNGGLLNTDWAGYEAPVLAATGGRVVWTGNDRPEVPPFTGLDDNPSVTKPTHFRGNGVVVRVRPGVFAHYYHLLKGSVRVRKGQRVRVGRRLGALGNSGNTNGAHLHFALSDGPHPLTSNSLPFEIDRSRFQGNAALGPIPGELILTGKSRGMRRAHPLLSSVSRYRR